MAKLQFTDSDKMIAFFSTASLEDAEKALTTIRAIMARRKGGSVKKGPKKGYRKSNAVDTVATAQPDSAVQ